MPTYLYIHKARTESPQHRFRSEYELRAMDYELRREVSSKGEIISDVAGGKIRAVIDVFGDDDLFRWLFRPDVEESGEIVTTDLHERVIVFENKSRHDLFSSFFSVAVVDGALYG